MSRRSKNTLSCKHTVSYEDVPPEIGDEVWCAMCSEYRFVRDVQVFTASIPSWKWKCRSKHGGGWLIKSYPGQKLECEKRAIGHAKRNGHVVDMYKPDGTLHHSYTGHDSNQLSLPDEASDEMPF